MSEEVRSMFASIANKYDTVNTVLSFGVHHRWRKKAVKWSQAKPGDHVLDCATGTGDLAIAYKKAVGDQGRVLGTDFCAEMMETAPDKSKKAGLVVEYEVADVLNLPYPDHSFTISSISFGIRNTDDPLQCLREMARVVKSGGRVVVIEFGQPSGLMKYPYTFYQKYWMPFVGGLLSGNREAYVYLPKTSAAFPAGNDFLALMDKAGVFQERKAHSLTGGIAYIYIGTVA
jgi:demethylmenaquinone methyltransferase / 2-methoxy-6-polyprenyl-1,4-benzoquinol methylase